jgi:uncharacterized protein
MPMPEPVSNLSPLSLADIARLVEGTSVPPVEAWHPAREGKIDIRIARDGCWYHEGGLITRPNMVRLFSSILRREGDGSYVLITPAEKLAIEVEDVPFIAVELKSEGEGQSRQLAFRLNTGDIVLAGPSHPLRFGEAKGEPAPYLTVRGGMEARLARPVFYELAEMALHEAASPPGIWSGGVFFAMMAE